MGLNWEYCAELQYLRGAIVAHCYSTTNSVRPYMACGLICYNTVLVHRRIRYCRPDTGHSCNARTPPRSSCSAWMALVVPRPEPGVSIVMDLFRPARAGSCSSSVDLQHSFVRVLFSPSAMLDFSPSRERESLGHGSSISLSYPG